MSAIAPFAASSFAPEERPQQLPAKASAGRTGRHEPIRSTTSRIAARGAGLGLTMAAGVAGGINYLQRDLELALPGADRVTLEQAARHTAGNPETGRALGLLGRVAVLRALL